LKLIPLEKIWNFLQSNFNNFLFLTKVESPLKKLSISYDYFEV